MRLLFSSQSGPEVGLLKNLLEENGIVAEVRNESAHSNFPGAAFQPEVWIVNDEDYRKACEVRDTWCQPASAPNGPSQEGSDSRAALWFLCVLSFAFGIGVAYQGFRARSWAHLVVAAFMFGGFALIVYAIRHLPPARRSRSPSS